MISTTPDRDQITLDRDQPQVREQNISEGLQSFLNPDRDHQKPQTDCDQHST